MSGASLALVVIRASNVERTRAFYRGVGLEFVTERHGDGVEHFACDVEGTVFEVYPLARQSDQSSSVRLGFRVPSVETTLVALEGLGVPVVSDLAETPWGKRAVVCDPDGRKVELIENRPNPSLRGTSGQS